MNWKKSRVVLLAAIILNLSLTGIVYASDVNKLYFEEIKGEMVYDSKLLNEENAFLKMENMIPGGSYHDVLEIKNGTGNKSYNLYLEMLLPEQEYLPERLLQYLEMEVRHNGQLIYQGTAAGRAYENESELQNAIFLGTYAPKASGKIDVSVKLSGEAGNELSNVTALTDWRFMVTEVDEQGKPDPETPDTSDPGGSGGGKPGVKPLLPSKTGDGTLLYNLVVILLLSGMILTIIIGRRVKK